jgi:hypothetical protein
MKNLTYLCIILALLIAMGGCQKTTGVSTIKLEATSYSIKTGQLDTLQLTGAASTDSIRWSVSPISGLVGLYHSGNHAVVNFNAPGTYTVTATLNNTTPYNASITVAQAPAPPVDTTTTMPTHVSLAGDQILMTASYNKSPNSDSAYVYFTAKTTKFYYCLNSYLTYNTTLNNTSGFTLNIVDIIKPATKDCQVGSIRLTIGAIPFGQSVVNKYLATGTFPLNVTLNGITYTGSVAVTATDININWNYTSGVTITPTHFTR